MADACKPVVSKRVEVDIPHALEQWLAERPAGSPLSSCRIADAAACYQFNNASCYQDPSLTLHSISVCDVPVRVEVLGRRWSPNSGSHRIVAELHYAGEPFVIALEEKENGLCGYDRDLIFVGALSARGREMAHTDDFGLRLVRRIIRSATGVAADIETTKLVPEFDYMAMKMEKSPRLLIESRLQVRVVDGEQLRSQGCNLSAEARGCLLISDKD